MTIDIKSVRCISYDFFVLRVMLFKSTLYFLHVHNRHRTFYCSVHIHKDVDIKISAQDALLE